MSREKIPHECEWVLVGSADKDGLHIEVSICRLCLARKRTKTPIKREAVYERVSGES